MPTYYVVMKQLDHGRPEYVVAIVNERNRAPKVVSYPCQTSRHAWSVAERLATSCAKPGPGELAHYTTLPQELCAVVDPDNPGPRACWKVTE